MEIYYIKLDYKYAIGDVVSNKNGNIFDGNLLDDLLKGYLTFGWITSESSIHPNITIIASELFSIDNKAKTFLESLLHRQIFNEISIDNTKYNVTMDIPILEGVLNIKQSKIKYFSTGEIMEVKKPVFISRDFPPLFRTYETDNALFCTGTFKDTVTQNGLTGLLFQTCKIESESWLHKLLK